MESFIYKGTLTEDFADREKWNYLGSCSLIDNPEYLDVILDSSNKIIEGIQMNGMKYLGAGMNIGGNEYYVMENPEWIRVVVDGDGKVLCGIKQNGKFYADIDGIDEQVQKLIQPLMNEVEELVQRFDEIFKLVENPEFLSVELDSDEKVLGGRKFDGTKFENVGLDLGGGLIKGMDDPEGRMEVKIDSDEKVISYRKEDGTLVENAGVETNHLELTQQGMSDFQQALKDNGFAPGGIGDWSDYISNDGDNPLHLPTPRCAIMNLTNETNDAVWPQAKFLDLQYIVEFWDMQGNYFKKKVVANAQGNSSLGMPKKNLAIDLFDEDWDDDALSIKFGNWVPQDSFHIKAYYADYFVGVCPIGYKLFDQIISTRNIYENRDWKKALIPDKSEIGTNTRALADLADKYTLDNDARCFPDGFPVMCYLNGEFYGVFSWQIKKHRDNYMMSKKKPLHIHLDGSLSYVSIFGVNGNLNWDIISGKVQEPGGGYDGIEVRNPKPKKKSDGWDLTCIDNTRYDGDTNRKELIGEDNPEVYDPSNTSHVNTNKTKMAMITLSTYVPHLKQMEDGGSSSSEIREQLASYFDIQSFIDYIILGDVTANFDGFKKNWQWITYDGIKWYVEPYDMDGIFGWSGWGEIQPTEPLYGRSKEIPSGWIAEYYSEELKLRYKELRDLGILATSNILSIFKEWISAIGTDNMQNNHDKWPNDREHYSAGPIETHMDSVYRVSNWLDLRISKCDIEYNYN